ncbi:MAG: DUF3368 domain-containing protein [Acidobacteriota bacterium]
MLRTTWPMPAVSNTSPLLNLAIIDHLELIRLQFEEVIIGPAVLAELKSESDLPGAASIKRALEANWLQVVELRSRDVACALERDLDVGEAEAIALAVQTGSRVILMDEHDGRIIAKTMGLMPVGVLGIALRAKHMGHLSSVETVLGALKSEAGFYVGDELAEMILREAGEG